MRCFVRLCLFAVFFAFSSAAFAGLTFPKLTGRVVDGAHILSASSIQSLDRVLAEHERATTNQVVVVTIPSLQGATIEDYGYQLARQWGIGQKGKDNGVLLIVAPKERKVRIEVGYGVEGIITDAAAHAIIQNAILPFFRNGQMEKGVVSGATTIVGLLGGKIRDTDIRSNAEEPRISIEQFVSAYKTGTAKERTYLGLLLFLFVTVLALAAALVCWTYYAMGRAYSAGVFGSRSGRAGGGGDFWDRGIVGGNLWGGGFNGGGFGGGGGGFGGGGASGSW